MNITQLQKQIDERLRVSPALMRPESREGSMKIFYVLCHEAGDYAEPWVISHGPYYDRCNAERDAAAARKAWLEGNPEAVRATSNG